MLVLFTLGVVSEARPCLPQGGGPPPGHVYFVDIDTADPQYANRDGSSIKPYISLTEAVNRAPLQGGDAILMAGSRQGSLYEGRDEDWAVNKPDHECFPIRVPAGVTVGYWLSQSDRGPGLLPAQVEILQNPFLAPPHSEPMLLVDATTGSDAITFDFYSDPGLPHQYPYVYPGLKAWYFTSAVKVQPDPLKPAGPINISFKGVLFEGNTTALDVVSTSSTDQVVVDVRRCLFRKGPDGRATDYFIRADFTNGGILTLGLTRSDLRSGWGPVQNEAIYLNGSGPGAQLTLQGLSVDVSNLYEYGSTQTPYDILQSGIRMAASGGAEITANLTNVSITGTRQKGFLGELFLGALQQTKGTFIADSDCAFYKNDEDGVRLVGQEGTVWELVKFFEARSTENGGHGLALDFSAGGNLLDGFPTIDLRRSRFLSNGVSLTSPGSGVWADVDAGLMNAFILTCRFSGNGRSGVSMSQDFLSTYTSSFFAGNSFFSLNQGWPAGTAAAAPLYLHYGGTNYDPNGGVTCYLLYDTIVDNERSGFGFTYDNAAHAAANAWTTGSAIESSVFYDLGLGNQDHAFFPLPDSTNQLWLRIAPTTNGCWLADPDPQHVAWAPYHHSLNPPGGGVYLPGVGWDPDLVMDPFLEFGKNYGQIFPASGCILLDNGIPQAALQTDHLGNPRPAGAGNDIGCFERQ